MFETKEGLEKGMREATKNLDKSDNIGGGSRTSWTPEFSATSLVMKFMPLSKPSLVFGLFSKSSQL